MAVQPKHTDLPPRYEAPDFTTDQRQRFTTVANAAEKRRDVYRRALEKKGFVEKMTQRALTPVVRSRAEKPRKTRQVIWLITFLIAGLWAMYMFA
ncbi:hypothetical protein [Vibrio alfacsensis]|uniref:hypothetical protein n=1 Tax=Vibrio alfacsensis TaxID=1074311 RepID=UPI001BF04D43|nr:hypothetical protein [Vibrio alfacsensis]WQE77676.1 hypothetical protein SO574_17960 [Vibrio alfacsensis]BCN26895.1 hypothetical protein VYA_40870 [Vibrio alfacsensis]